MTHIGEEHGIPMMRVFRAIMQLEQNKKLATSSRIADILKKRTTTILVLYWRWGYVGRKPVQTVNRKRNVDHCVWYYYVTPKGKTKYQRLVLEFGDLDQIDSVRQRMAPGVGLEDIPNSVPPEISPAKILGDIPNKQVK